MPDMMNPLTRDGKPIQRGCTVWILDWKIVSRGERLNGIRPLKVVMPEYDYVRCWASRNEAARVCLAKLDSDITLLRDQLEQAIKHRAEVADRLARED